MMLENEINDRPAEKESPSTEFSDNYSFLTKNRQMSLSNSLYFMYVLSALAEFFLSLSSLKWISDEVLSLLIQIQRQSLISRDSLSYYFARIIK